RSREPPVLPGRGPALRRHRAVAAARAGAALRLRRHPPRPLRRLPHGADPRPARGAVDAGLADPRLYGRAGAVVGPHGGVTSPPRRRGPAPPSEDPRGGLISSPRA